MDEINETEHIKMTSKVEKIPWIGMSICRLDNGPNQYIFSCSCFNFDWFNNKKLNPSHLVFVLSNINSTSLSKTRLSQCYKYLSTFKPFEILNQYLKAFLLNVVSLLKFSFQFEIIIKDQVVKWLKAYKIPGLSW